MFETFSTQCKWHQCEKMHGHHTPIEWENHKHYAKLDLPKGAMVQETYVVDDARIRLKLGTGALPQQQKQSHRTTSLRSFAIGFLICAWSIITVSALFHYIFNS